jgi:hypothetical protein
MIYYIERIRIIIEIRDKSGIMVQDFYSLYIFLDCTFMNENYDTVVQLLRGSSERLKNYTIN